jgi:hypothetical protein
MKTKHYLDDLDADGKTLLKWMSKKEHGTGLTRLKMESIVGSCEQGDELSMRLLASRKVSATYIKRIAVSN